MIDRSSLLRSSRISRKAIKLVKEIESSRGRCKTHVTTLANTGVLVQKAATFLGRIFESSSGVIRLV